MDNRLVKYMHDVVDAIFLDGFYLYPSVRELERDKTRLHHQIDSRGINLLILEFPALAKHLNRCLDQGSYTNPHLVLSNPMEKGVEIPRFLRQIYLRIFEKNGKMVPDPCVNAVLFLKTLLTCWKSIKLPASQGVIENEVSSFFERDAALPDATLAWGDDDLGALKPHERSLRSVFTDLGSDDERYLSFVFATTSSDLGLSPHLWGDEPSVHLVPKHGPGVVANLPRGESKYRFPHWPNKLQQLFPYDLFALPNPGFAIDPNASECGFDDKKSPSRLIAVPKTIDRPRLIAAEPVENQWIQQMLWSIMRDRVHGGILSDSIMFSSQTPNQELALSGSIDGANATVDLSEASDRLSCALVERFFIANASWLEALHACRTHVCAYRINSHETISRPLKKFSTMGSTVIFPLQSIIYASIAIAAIMIDRRERLSTRNIKSVASQVRVFGDDIIVPKAHLGTLVRLLEGLCFKVNQAKTFSGDNFRESCGVDAFKGYVVTPPKLLVVPNGRPSQYSSLIETSNNWYKAGFWNVACYIQTYVKGSEWLLPISADSSQQNALLSYCGLKTQHLRRRWNRNLQCWEYRVWKDSVRLTESRIPGFQRLLQYFTEDPDPHTKWSSGTVESAVVVTRPGWITVYS